MAERAGNELPTPLRPLYAQTHASKTGMVINYDYHPPKISEKADGRIRSRT